MDDSKRINKHDSIIDVIYFKTKNTTKVETVLTEFDAELPEKELSYG